MEDIADLLLDPEEKCKMSMRIRAALRIQRLRSVIHQIAPYDGDVYRNIVSKLLPKEELESLYWVEHQKREEAEAAARAKAEADAIAWIGA